MPEMLRILGIAKGAEQMSLVINSFPPANQVEIFTMLSDNIT